MEDMALNMVWMGKPLVMEFEAACKLAESSVFLCVGLVVDSRNMSRKSCK